MLFSNIISLFCLIYGRWWYIHTKKNLNSIKKWKTTKLINFHKFLNDPIIGLRMFHFLFKFPHDRNKNYLTRWLVKVFIASKLSSQNYSCLSNQFKIFFVCRSDFLLTLFINEQAWPSSLPLDHHSCDEFTIFCNKMHGQINIWIKISAHKNLILIACDLL